MPTITERKSLGSLFGGNIASINYNFQAGSEPSTATITIVSESNSFLIPDWNELVSIPPFGFSMLKTKHSIRDDTNYKTLQIELIDGLSSVLDTELVLVYGEHTDPYYKLNNPLYDVYEGTFFPKSVYPPNSQFNTDVKFPTLVQNYVKEHGGGINVIGIPRATYVQNRSQNITGSSRSKESSEWWSFDAGNLNEQVSSFRNSFNYSANKSGSINVKYGYTLKNLSLLMSSKNISFDSSSNSIMSNEDILFSESGTIRDVLTACLSKIGRSFYVDPFTQKIKIISNSDISRINSNLKSKYSNFSSVSGAKQISLSESIAEVEAKHFVIKGDLNYSSSNRGPRSEKDRALKQVLYKLDADSLAGDLKTADVELIKRISPLVYTISDNDALDRYLFGLGLVYPTNEWGTLYGIEEYRAGDFQEKTKNADENSQNLKEWEKFIIDNHDNFDFVYYQLSDTVGARELYQGTDGEVMARSGSDSNYYQDVKDFSSLWAGVYFSVPMNLSEVESRNYQDQAKWLLGLDNSFDFVIVNGESYIGEIESLQFLYRLLKRIGAKTNYKVKEIAKRAYKDAIGEGDYFLLGIRKMFYGSEINSDELHRLIMESFYSFDDISSNTRYLLYTKNAAEVVAKIEKACLEAFKKEASKVKDKLVVKYTLIEPDEDPSENSNQEELHETPSALSILNQNSNVTNFSKRSLTVFQDRIEEVKLFLENMGELNPQFSGPFITTEIEYYRPPLKTDFDMENGVDSVSVSISDKGVSTNIKYSSRKFAEVDGSLIREMLGSSAGRPQKSFNPNAFTKNRTGR